MILILRSLIACEKFIPYSYREMQMKVFFGQLFTERSKVVELNDGRIPICSKGIKLLLLNIRGLANDIKGDINIADTFNNYFVDLNKPSDNADDLTYVVRTNFTESNCNEEFVFSPVDDDTILRELSRLGESTLFSVGIFWLLIYTKLPVASLFLNSIECVFDIEAILQL